MHKLIFPIKLTQPSFVPQLRRFCTIDDQYWYKPQFGLETGIKVYNTVAHRKVPVILPNEHFVSWYTCGPTVYDSSHLGHASCYVKLDIIQKILRNHFQMNLVTAMNITDIDDKIINKSQETGKNWRDISRHYETEFWNDMRKLGIAEPNIKLRVTEHIPQIIAFIKDIMSNGFAYVGKDKSVYFDTHKFPIYGKLQKLNLTSTEVEENKNKFAVEDFALWKAKKTDDEPSWDSPWGAGRPGWHIECSTLASLIFGKHIDFHAGGLDLRFPHHENEEAQCCVFHNSKQWVNYWLHTGQLNQKGQLMKMSKSLKNTISIGDMLKHYSADEFRMACAISNYRNSMEYSSELMETACNTLNRFKSFQLNCEAYISGKKAAVPLEESTILKNLSYAKSQLDACYKDDFDTARAISVLMEQIANLNRSINVTNVGETPNLLTSTCLDAVAAVDNFIKDSLHDMGFTAGEAITVADSTSIEDKITLDHLLEDLLSLRKVIRERAINNKSKELFETCDEMRNILFQNGVDVRDHSKGSTWTFVKKSSV